MSGEETFNEVVTKNALGERVENNFSYHAPKDGQRERYEALRAKAKELAMLILDLTPVSQEQHTAILMIEDSVMWANAAIARNE